MNDKTITVIIPVHKKLNDEEVKLFNDAIKSIPSDCKVIVVGKKTFLPKQNNSRFDYLINDGDLDFCSQINFAVSKIATDYFSILEFDDKYTPIWEENFKRYSNSHVNEASGYLFLNELYDYSNMESPIGYINEAVWASSFSNEIGYLDTDCLNDYSNFNLTGAIFNKNDFIEVGGLKPSMKLSFWYEFMLRFLHNGKTMYVIPKVGYYHRINRKDSLIDIYQTSMDSEEAQWWMDLAKKEYFFKTDRKKSYK